MKLLDWYILKRFLQTYIFVVLVIVLVVVMIDYTEKVDNFHKTQRTRQRNSVRLLPEFHSLLGQLHQSADGVYCHRISDLTAGSPHRDYCHFEQWRQFYPVAVSLCAGRYRYWPSLRILWSTTLFQRPTKPELHLK